MKKFKELKVRNNWENLEYYYDGRRLRTNFKNKTGYEAFVLYPSGKIEKTDLKFRSRKETYSDMGHCYTAVSMMAYIERIDEVTGLPMVIQLCDHKDVADLKFYIINPKLGNKVK